MSIQVIKSGILDIVQDFGRTGYARWGVNPGGAMDRYAHQLANALVGNNLKEATIEIHFPAGEFLFRKDLLISLTGANFEATVNGIEITPGKPVAIKRDAVLSFRNKRKGNRCYLAVQGGFDIQPWLESRSTNLKIGVGGMDGRMLKKNDVIPTGNSQLSADQNLFKSNFFYEFPWTVNTARLYAQPNDISFVEGNEWQWLSQASRHRITDEEFRLDPTSDRMAYYLQQEPLVIEQGCELLSSAVSFGTIQALPSGMLTVLMADHQTTGGYPRIGHVITSDLPKLAQLGAHDKIRLHKISQPDAEKMVFSLAQELKNISQSCREKLNMFYDNR